MDTNNKDLEKKLGVPCIQVSEMTLILPITNRGCNSLEFA